MAIKKFSISEALSFGWNKTKENFLFFLGLLLFTGILYYGPDLIAEIYKKRVPALYIIFSLASWVISIIVQMGLIKITLKFCDNEKPGISELFSCVRLFFYYLLANILYALIVLGGFLLLIVPGVIWAIKYQFYGYLVVDKNLGPIEAIKQSGRITAGAKWDLFFFGIICIGIVFTGVLALLVGLFVAMPVVMLAVAFVYRQLLLRTELPQAAIST